MVRRHRWIWLGVAIISAIAGLQTAALAHGAHRPRPFRQSGADTTTGYSGTIAYQRAYSITEPTGEDCDGGQESYDLSENWQISFTANTQVPGSGVITGSYSDDVTCADGFSVAESASGTGGVEVGLSVPDSGPDAGQVLVGAEPKLGEGLPGTATRNGAHAESVPFKYAPLLGDPDNNGDIVANGDGVTNLSYPVWWADAGFESGEDQQIQDGAMTITLHPSSGGAAPVARCDVYDAAPGSTLNVPASQGLLSNDTGTGLTANVLKVSAGVSAHPDLDRQTGALMLMVPRTGGLRTLELAYDDTAPTGQISNVALVTIVVSESKLSAKQLKGYCVNEGPATSFSSATKRCTTTRLTTHHLHIDGHGVDGTLSWAARTPGEGNNVCVYPSLLTNRWSLQGGVSVKWSGKPQTPDEIGIEDDVSVNGYDTRESAGILPRGISLATTSASKRALRAVKRSHSTFESIEFSKRAVNISGVAADELTQTITPYIALPGYHNDATVDPLAGSSPAAHVCAKKDVGVIVGISSC